MTDELMSELPANVKGRMEIIDKDWSQTFKFEEMPCTHSIDAKSFEKVNCDKCNFMIAEKDIEDKLSNQDLNETVQDKDPDNGGQIVIRTLSKIVIRRGKFDDAMGIEKHFT